MKSRVLRAKDYREVDVKPLLKPFAPDEAALEAELRRLTNPYIRWETGTTVSPGDQVVCRLASDCPRFQKEKVRFVAGSGMFHRDLEDMSIGMEAGETRETVLPEGKVSLTLTGVMNRVVPEASDEMVEKLGLEGVHTVAAYRAYLLEQQKEAAALLAAKEIRTVDEYTAKVKSAQEAEIPAQSNLPDRLPEPQYIEPVADKPVEAEPPAPAGDCPLHTGHAVSLKDVVAELKDPDKDCSGTPDSFLAEYEAFTRKFHKEIGWYNDPYYDTVFPSVSPEQLASLRELTDSICLAAEELFHKVERTMKNEQLQKKT